MQNASTRGQEPHRARREVSQTDLQCLEYWGLVRGQDQRGPTEGGRPGRRMGVVQAIEAEVWAFERCVESQGRPEAGLGHIQPEGAGPLRQEPGSI